jgi:hypothetical protein
MRFAPCQTIGPRGMSTIPGPAGCLSASPTPDPRIPTLRATFDLGEPPLDDAAENAASSVEAATGIEAKEGEAIRFCIAVDFDGVLAHKAWPAIGKEMPGAMAFLRWINEQGWWRILFSCREGGHLKAAMGWLEKRGFAADWWTAINATPKPISDLYESDSKKPGFHALVDDLAIGFPTKSGGDPDWAAIKAELEERAAAWTA